jgi:Mg-chelatase subunit ChlD
MILFAALSPANAGDKSKYDIVEPKGDLAKTSADPFFGWKLTRTVAEVAVLPGGYVTMGTTAGTSASALDDNCGILFGHPYAKTSYPLIQLDAGGWRKYESIFPPESLKAVVQGDSITLTFRGHPSLRATVSYRLINNGQRLQITSTVENTDVVPHSVGSGFILDPALGVRGDGVLLVDGVSVLSESSMNTSTITGKSLTISERRGTNAGMRCLIEFPLDLPSTLAAENWEPLQSVDGPDLFGMGTVLRLYDLVLKAYWDSKTIAAGGHSTESILLSLQTPQFGTLFTRWDVPSFAMLDDGVLYPSELTTTATVTNQTVSPVTSTLRFAANDYVSTPLKNKDVAIEAGKRGYVAFPLTFGEVYENLVTDLVMITSQSAQASDSLIIPLFIPATPVSDTGLSVTIDSLAKASAPAISVVFESERTAIKQKLFSLKAGNVFLYEDAVRLRDFTLGKDTSGGANGADIIFVLDVTGSMTNQIEAVKNNIIEFADSLKARGIDYRLGMVTFLDIIENVYDFTSDVQVFKNEVALQYAHGGGDAPENSLDALYRASQFTFREGAGRIIIWITDITFHEKDNVTPRSRQEVINRLLEMDITVHAIGTAGYETDWYKPITDATGGNYYNISGNFRDILLDIGRLKATSRYVLRYTSPAVAGQHTVKIEIHYAGLGGSATTTYTTPGTAEEAGSLVCFPNPFNPQTTIRIAMPKLGSARVAIYNVLGQHVRSYDVKPGAADLVWDARDEEGRYVASGIYIIRSTLYSSHGEAIAGATAKVLHLK